MNSPLIDDTRPRIASGVASCRMVVRSTTDTPSHTPDSISRKADSQNCVDRPKPMMHRPKPATAHSSIRPAWRCTGWRDRSEEHTSELQSLMRNSYAVFCLKKKMTQSDHSTTPHPKTTTRHNISRQPDEQIS